jgi:hypothetical protein
MKFRDLTFGISYVAKTFLVFFCIIYVSLLLNLTQGQKTII